MRREPPPSPPLAPRPSPPPTWAKVVVSSAILLQVSAVLTFNLAASPMASPLNRAMARPFDGYLRLTDQRQSHRYYAPEPPPTPVVTAVLHFDDGRPDREVRLPDRSHRPRLLYQRELALAHHLFVDFNEARDAPGGPFPSRLGESYARHLCKSTPRCSGLTLFADQHLNPDLARYADQRRRHPGEPLDVESSEFYAGRERIGDYSCEGF